MQRQLKPGQLSPHATRVMNIYLFIAFILAMTFTVYALSSKPTRLKARYNQTARN